MHKMEALQSLEAASSSIFTILAHRIYSGRFFVWAWQLAVMVVSAACRQTWLFWPDSVAVSPCDQHLNIMYVGKTWRTTIKIIKRPSKLLCSRFLWWQKSHLLHRRWPMLCLQTVNTVLAAECLGSSWFTPKLCWMSMSIITYKPCVSLCNVMPPFAIGSIFPGPRCHLLAKFMNMRVTSMASARGSRSPAVQVRCSFWINNLGCRYPWLDSVKTRVK